jgi:hypothetical protein
MFKETFLTGVFYTSPLGFSENQITGIWGSDTNNLQN